MVWLVFCLLCSLADGLTLLGHRGGALYLIPEHSKASYSIGAQNGAQYIEPDLVSTKDGQLLCLHGHELSRTTNVAQLPQYKDRKTTVTLHSRGKAHTQTGWFTENFTLAEIQGLDLHTAMYPASLVNASDPAPLDNIFHLMPLSEMLATVKHLSKILERPLGVYPETKSPGYFRSIGLPMEQKVIDTLVAGGFLGPGGTRKNFSATDDRSLVLLQSFDPDSVQRLGKITKGVPLFQLVDDEDLTRKGFPNLSPEGIAEIGKYADGLGFSSRIAQGVVANNKKSATPLLLHEYTLGQNVTEYLEAVSLNIDGVFSNDVDTGRVTLDMLNRHCGNTPSPTSEPKQDGYPIWVVIVAGVAGIVIGGATGMLMGKCRYAPATKKMPADTNSIPMQQLKEELTPRNAPEGTEEEP